MSLKESAIPCLFNVHNSIKQIFRSFSIPVLRLSQEKFKIIIWPAVSVMPLQMVRPAKNSLRLDKVIAFETNAERDRLKLLNAGYEVRSLPDFANLYRSR